MSPSGTSTRSIWRIGGRLLLVGAIVTAGSSFVQAGDYTSSSFIVRDPVMGQGTLNDGSSSNFQLRGMAGDTAPGNGTSTNFQQESGSEYMNDTTAPTGGTVADGAGADIDYQTSMTAIAANWTGFADAESGLRRYDYRLQRTVDGMCWNAGGNAWAACSVWNNNSTNTSYSLNHANLALRTGTTYIACVRAVNNAGITGPERCSNGLRISPSMVFSYNTTTVNLPTLNPSNSWNGTGSSTLSIETNAYDGYTVYGSKTDLMRSITYNTRTISDVADGGCSGSAVSWPGATRFGFTSSDDIDGNKFNSGGTKYCAFPTTATPTLGMQVADRVSTITGGTVSEDHTITYRVQVDASQSSGQYQTSILYTILPRY